MIHNNYYQARENEHKIHPNHEQNGQNTNQLRTMQTKEIPALSSIFTKNKRRN